MTGSPRPAREHIVGLSERLGIEADDEMERRQLDE